LLEYIHEQAKEIDPRRLPTRCGTVTGDHIWLRIQRLEADSPPPIPDS
jgi:hypothetical protein